MNIDSNSYSVDEVAKYLGINANDIYVLYSKDKDVVNKGYHEFYDQSIKTSSGETLHSDFGYYVSRGGNQECVYAEYSNSAGKKYSYVKHPGSSVASQIKDDREVYKSQNSNRSKTNMSDLTTMSLSSLKDFRDGLEDFKEAVTKQCDTLEDSIVYNKDHMKDETSQEMCRKGLQIIANIRECIDPVIRINTLLADVIGDLESNEFNV